jgi:quercetin dioxygenase-like cupin family protein
MNEVGAYRPVGEGPGKVGLPTIFAKNENTSALAIKSVEGGAIVGMLLVKQLIRGDEMTLLEIQVEPGVVSPLHAHAHESLIYVVKGKLKSVVGGEAYVLGPGDVCRHPREVPHFIEALDGSTFIEIKSPVPDLTRVLGT